jgi:hypothetical protein
MKRSGIKRKTQLQRGQNAALRRRKGLSRGKPSRKAQTRSAPEYIAARATAFLRAGGKCECGCGRAAEEPHHIWPEEKWPALVAVPDNIICISRICHARHTSAFRRLPRYAIRRAERLATDEGMKAYLDRAYDRRSLHGREI